ncbi:MAG: aspartate aminotransferase family protein, partial [Chloroflexota bacterium]
MSTLTEARTIRERELNHASGVYAKRNLTLVRGQGAWVWDDQGKRYIDGTGGYGTANLGHA